MSLKLEHEKLSKEIEFVGCNKQGCNYCNMEDKCKRLQFLEKYCKKQIQ
jgi:hypothetical protein